MIAMYKMMTGKLGPTNQLQPFSSSLSADGTGAATGAAGSPSAALSYRRRPGRAGIRQTCLCVMCGRVGVADLFVINAACYSRVSYNYLFL